MNNNNLNARFEAALAQLHANDQARAFLTAGWELFLEFLLTLGPLPDDPTRIEADVLQRFVAFCHLREQNPDAASRLLTAVRLTLLRLGSPPRLLDAMSSPRVRRRVNAQSGKKYVYIRTRKPTPPQA
jgi:hypothetical protein